MQTLPLMRPAATFVFFIALIADAQCVSAGPVFQVQGAGGQGSFNLSSSSFLSHGSVGVFSTTDPVNGHTIAQASNAFAAAGPGVLRVDANSRAFRNFVSNLSGNTDDRITASANAIMTLDDVIISGPVGMITTSYNIHLNGTLEAFADLQAPSSG